MVTLGYGFVSVERPGQDFRFVFRNCPMPAGDEDDPESPMGRFRRRARRCMALALLDAEWVVAESDLATLRGWAEDRP